MSAPLRPLTLGELLDRTFSLYRSNFVLFIGIVALPQLISLAVQLWLIIQPTERTPSFGGTMFLLFETLGLGLLSALLMAFAQAATVMAVSRVHLEHPVSISSAYSSVSDKVGKVFFATLATGFLEGIGFVLLIVPGVLMFLRWALVVPVAVLEGGSIGDLMSRSSTLTEGHRGRILAIFSLYIVLLIALGIAWTVIRGLVTGSLTNALAPTMSTRIAAQVTSFLTQCVLGPLVTISMALVYYDERVRKEAFDIENMVAELDAPTLSATT